MSYISNSNIIFICFIMKKIFEIAKIFNNKVKSNKIKSS